MSAVRWEPEPRDEKGSARWVGRRDGEENPSLRVWEHEGKYRVSTAGDAW